MSNFRNFVSDEEGAVTVDWVVLTAAVVGIAIAVALTIETGLNAGAGQISTNLGTQVANLTGTDQSGPMTFDDYINAASGNFGDALAAVEDDAPDGYFSDHSIDMETGLPIYSDYNSGNPTAETYNIGGEVILASEYTGTKIYI